MIKADIKDDPATHPSTPKPIELSNAMLIQTKQGQLTRIATEKLDIFTGQLTMKSFMSGEFNQIEIYGSV